MKKLVQWAKDALSDFEAYYADRSCECWRGMPPCGWCLHEGNPINLAETESAWEKIGMNLEKQVAAAETRLAVALEKDVAAHQAVMTAEFRHQEVVRELMQELDARRWRERIEDIFVGV